MIGEVLNRQICNPNFEWESSDVVSALMTSFSTTKTPAGVSEIFLKYGESRQKFDLTPNNLFLSDVLTKIITVEPRYQWRKEENGVVNVFPVDDYSILNERIPEFKFDNKNKGELIRELIKTKEFKKYLKDNNLSTYPLTICCGLQDPRPPRQFSIEIKNATVREILNEIVRLNGASTWLYHEYESKFVEETTKRYYDLYFLVQNY